MQAAAAASKAATPHHEERAIVTVSNFILMYKFVHPSLKAEQFRLPNSA